MPVEAVMERTTEPKNALAAAYELYGGMVYNVCLRTLGNAEAAEDATQAVFLLLVKKAPSLHLDGRLAGWLMRTAELVARKGRQTEFRRLHRERKAAAMKQNTGSSESAENDAWREVRPQLDGAIASLPEKYRTPVVMVYLAGCAQKDVAQSLGLNEGTLRWRLSHAIERLRGKLGGGKQCSAALLAVVLKQFALDAVPPAKLLPSIVRAAHALSQTGGECAALSASVKAYMDGGTKAMFWIKAKFVSAALLSAILLTIPLANYLARTAEQTVEGNAVPKNAPESPPRKETGKTAAELLVLQRMNLNEIAAEAACKAFADAEEHYRQDDYANSGVLQYAQRLRGKTLPSVDSAKLPVPTAVEKAKIEELLKALRSIKPGVRVVAPETDEFELLKQMGAVAYGQVVATLKENDSHLLKLGPADKEYGFKVQCNALLNRIARTSLPKNLEAFYGLWGCADGSLSLIDATFAEAECDVGCDPKTVFPKAGYLFRVLLQQGEAASGGKKNYMLAGHMTEGYALLAFPMEYGKTGRYCFMIGEDRLRVKAGVVYRRDFGDAQSTNEFANRCSEFNPTKDWSEATLERLSGMDLLALWSETDIQRVERALTGEQRKLMDQSAALCLELEKLEARTGKRKQLDEADKLRRFVLFQYASATPEQQIELWKKMPGELESQRNGLDAMNKALDQKQTQGKTGGDF